MNPDDKGECEHDEGGCNDCLGDVCELKLLDILVISRQPSILWHMARECYIKVWS